MKDRSRTKVAKRRAIARRAARNLKTRNRKGTLEMDRHTETLAAYATRSDWTRGHRNTLTNRPMPESCEDAPVWEHATRYANRESLLGHGYGAGPLAPYAADRD